MRKLLWAVILLIFTLTFVGCGGGSDQQIPSQDTPKQENQFEKQLLEQNIFTEQDAYFTAPDGLKIDLGATVDQVRSALGDPDEEISFEDIPSQTQWVYEGLNLIFDSERGLGSIEITSADYIGPRGTKCGDQAEQVVAQFYKNPGELPEEGNQTLYSYKPEQIDEQGESPGLISPSSTYSVTEDGNFITYDYPIGVSEQELGQITEPNEMAEKYDVLSLEYLVYSDGSGVQSISCYYDFIQQGMPEQPPAEFAGTYKYLGYTDQMLNIMSLEDDMDGSITFEEDGTGYKTQNGKKETFTYIRDEDLITINIGGKEEQLHYIDETLYIPVAEPTIDMYYVFATQQAE